ncbi:hypothetical protein BJV74DRAFT_851530 [Russula compacta]|nr:hypothetical protein BJV74DRAFT_851530 [Russula compacta]
MKLLQTLLTQAATSLKEDLVPGRNPANLEQSRLYLELSGLLCREKGPSPEPGELTSMRRQVVDALTVILPFFLQIAPSDAQALRSCETLLQTCQQIAPLYSVLVEIVHLADEKQIPESKRVGDLSRVFVDSSPVPSALASCKTTKPPPPSVPPPLPVINLSADAEEKKAAAAIRIRRAGHEESDVPGERQGGQKLSIKGQHDHQQRKRKDSSPHQSATTGEETPSLLLRMGHPRRLSPKDVQVKIPANAPAAALGSAQASPCRVTRSIAGE